MRIEFINHFAEFFTINCGTYNVGSSAAAGFVKITVVESVTFFQVITLKPFPEIEEAFDIVTPLGNFPYLFRSEFKTGIVINNLGPVLEVGQGSTQKDCMVFADPKAVHGHIAVFLPEYLPGLTYIFGVLRAEGSMIGNRGTINLAKNLLWKVIEIYGRAASKMVRTP